MPEHDDIEQLLGAYALDAVDDDERRRVEAFLENNPRAQAEVQSYQEVAARLSLETENPPAGLWDRIVAALDAEAPDAGPALRRLMTPETRRRRWQRAAAAIAAAAACVVAAVAITVAVSGDDSPRDTESAIEEAFGEAWAHPRGRRAELASEDGRLTAEAVVLPDGRGFVSAKRLPRLGPRETYQLWGVFADGDVISLGVMGERPTIEPFTARGDIGAMVITKEEAGGVVSSTSGELLVGDLE